MGISIDLQVYIDWYGKKNLLIFDKEQLSTNTQILKVPRFAAYGVNFYLLATHAMFVYYQS